MKIRHRKMQHNLAAVESGGHENAGPCRHGMKNARQENAINGEYGI